MKKLEHYPGLIGFLAAIGIAGLVSFCVSVAAWAQTKTLPAGATGYTEIVEVLASESYVIPAIWNNSTVSIQQANGVTNTFRAAIGTSTVDVRLPLVKDVTVSFRSGGFVALQTGTASATLAVYHVKD